MKSDPLTPGGRRQLELPAALVDARHPGAIGMDTAGQQSLESIISCAFEWAVLTR